MSYKVADGPAKISFGRKKEPTVANNFAPGSNLLVRIPKQVAFRLIWISGSVAALAASLASSLVIVPRLSTRSKRIASRPSEANFSKDSD